MIENELLLAMSTLLDAKLEPIKADISSIKQELVEVKADIISIKQELVEVKADIISIKQELVEVKADIINIKQKMVEMEADIHNINLKLENDFEPKLQLLAENYVPAAKRYEHEVDKMEAMRVDIDVMKKVITEHSEKLQLLA